MTETEAASTFVARLDAWLTQRSVALQRAGELVDSVRKLIG